MLTWLALGWSGFLGNASTAFDLFAGGLGLRREKKERKARTLLEVAKAHHEMLAKVRSMPGTSGLWDRGRDLLLSPRTKAETDAANLFVLHFSLCYSLFKLGNFDLPDGLPADIQNFFTYPVRRDAWEELKRYQNRDLVAYVENARTLRL